MPDPDPDLSLIALAEQVPEVCAPDHCLNGVVCYAPSCYGSADYSRADQ